MTLTIHSDIVQRSDEWYALRRGIVTASVVGELITTRKLTAIDYACPACSAAAYDPCVGKAGAQIKTLHSERAAVARESAASVIEVAANMSTRSLTMLLAAERITGWTDPTYISDDMWRGIDDEHRARAAYAEHYEHYEHYAPVTEVGLMVEDRWGYRIGCSPDGLVGDDGMIEVKSRRPKVQLETILADEVPSDEMAQLQCGLLVSGRAWIDYLSYCGGMPLWVKRVYPQQEWLDAITGAVEAFEDAVDDIITIYRASVDGLPMTEREPEYTSTELKL